MLTCKQNKKIDIRFPHLGSLMFVAVLLLFTPIFSAHAQPGDELPRDGATQKVYVGAIEMDGFYLNISRDLVTIIDMKSYRKKSYSAAVNMIITQQSHDNENSEAPRLEIDQKSLLPHSIVKLIVVDAEVVEIILIQESS